MNPTQFLNHFGRLADAPDAVPRLRRFILDLAVRGKLVEQDSSDEPAAELLKHITAETVRTVKDGRAKDWSISPVASDEVWPIPATWTFVPLDALSVPDGLFTDGDWVESKDQDPNGDVRLIQLADVGLGEYRDRSARFMNSPTAARLNCTYLNVGDILIARMPDPLGRACIFPGGSKPSVTVVDVAVLRLGGSYFDAVFVTHAINSPQFARNIESKAAGTTRTRISRGNLSLLPFPLPPLAEQHRIVAKVDELMALCDRLEAAQTERESHRDILNAASLNRLNQPDTDAATFRENARFHLAHLPRLTARPEQIPQLRQTILDLAVRGKLVEQDPNDEPAAELLKRIEEEKSQLVKERKRRQHESLPSVKPNEITFGVPEGWGWTRLGTICNLITDGAHHTPSYQDKGVPFLSVKDVSGGSIDFSNTRFISENAHRELCKRCMPQFGDILLTKVGTTGIAVTVDNEREFSIFVSLALLKFSLVNLDRFYLKLLINSPLVKQQSADNTQGIGNKNLVLRLINQFVIPLPPLAEQQRIVAKVDELMALCDQLEAQLTSTQAESRRLLEAVLQEALAA